MFENRVDAAIKLCPKLIKFSNRKDVFVFGLVNGGIITASVIASKLNLKLKPLIVKKISTSNNPELALGAIASLKDIFLNKSLIISLGTSDLEINKQILEKCKQIKEISDSFKINYRSFLGKKILLVDDGVATGASVLVAEQFLRKRGARKIFLVTPVIANDTYRLVKNNFEGIIYLIKEKNFYAVGQFYKNFEQVSLEKVIEILNL